MQLFTLQTVQKFKKATRDALRLFGSVEGKGRERKRREKKSKEKKKEWGKESISFSVFGYEEKQKVKM